MGNKNSTEIEELNLCTNANRCMKNCCSGSSYHPKLYDTVKPYRRAIIICTGNRIWPAKIKTLQNTFVGNLMQEIALQSIDMATNVNITLCDEPNSTPHGYDIYVFPDKIKYIGMTELDINKFINNHLIHGKICDSIEHAFVNSLLITVCVHNSRDKRCGRMGPIIIDKIKEIIERKKIVDKIKVVGSSHIGGHKYAGIAVVYPSCDHYGLVNDHNIEEIIDHHLENGHCYQPLWKGSISSKN